MPHNFIQQLEESIVELETICGHDILISFLSASAICYYLLPLTITIFLLGILFFKNFK